jgi:DNA polymerase III delta prime subunit
VSTAEVPRPDLEAELRGRVEAGPPFLLAGPPGAGKTTLLLGLARALERDGWACLYLDLMGAASSPDRFVLSALDALPAERFGDRLREATEIRRLVSSGRPQHAQAVRGVLALWASLDRAGGRPVALLLDEATEIRSLAYFPSLREVDRLLVSALAARQRGTVLATSFPTLAQKSFGLPVLNTPPLTAAEVAAGLPPGSSVDAQDLLRVTFGWPRYVRVLLEQIRGGSSLAAAWAEEMAKGGRLEMMGHHTYEALLLRSRGYGISKAALDAVAREEGLNLKALVARLGRTPGATRDYLQWLVGVDALRMEGKRYFYVDGLVRQWVRLHASGRPASAADLRHAVEALLLEGAPAAGTTKEERADAPAESPAPRRDSLMEID